MAETSQGSLSLLKSRFLHFRILQAVLGIMQSRLGAIRSMWEEGILRAKGLGAQEVVRLIQALFEETDLRNAVIADIES